jgi:hypothetical protein
MVIKINNSHGDFCDLNCFIHCRAIYCGSVTFGVSLITLPSLLKTGILSD